MKIGKLKLKNIYLYLIIFVFAFALLFYNIKNCDKSE